MANDALMTLAELQRELTRRFDPAQATGLDAMIRLDCGGDSLDLRLEHGRLSFIAAGSTAAAPDVTFHFADGDTARELLLGSGDGFQAFMDGRFRADGHLMWAFQLMAMFRSQSLPEDPRD